MYLTHKVQFLPWTKNRPMRRLVYTGVSSLDSVMKRRKLEHEGAHSTFNSVCDDYQLLYDSMSISLLLKLKKL